MEQSPLRTEGGYALVTVVILLAVALIALTGTVDTGQAYSKTERSNRTRSVLYYESESTLQRTVAWMRNNSTAFFEPFMKENF